MARSQQTLAAGDDESDEDQGTTERKEITLVALMTHLKWGSNASL